MKIRITSEDSDITELLHKTITSDMLSIGWRYMDVKIIPDGYELEFEKQEGFFERWRAIKKNEV